MISLNAGRVTFDTADEPIRKKVSVINKSNYSVITGKTTGYQMGRITCPKTWVERFAVFLLMTGDTPAGTIVIDGEKIAYYGLHVSAVKRHMVRKDYYIGVAYLPGSWAGSEVLGVAI